MSNQINRSCVRCVRKKIKCDRIIPCSNCVKRGLEDECVLPSETALSAGEMAIKESFELQILNVMHQWDYWVVQQGFCNGLLLPCKVYTLDYSKENWHPGVIKLIDLEISARLLTHSVESIGCLYLNFFPDIQELFSKFDTFLSVGDSKTSNIGDLMNEALLWSLLTLAMYYLDNSVLKELGLPNELQELSTNKLYCEFLAYTIELIQKIQHYPDVRIVQMFLILSNTFIRYEFPLFYNHFLTNVLQISQILNLNTCFKTGSGSSTTSMLIKNVSDRMWYKLLYWDYKTESFNRPISLHSSLFTSLLRHAAFLKSQNPEKYVREDSLELLQWKITSLERDLDQYTHKKPSLKTLEVIRRELEILQVKSSQIKRLQFPESENEKFDLFVINLTIFSTHWKLLQMVIVFYYQDVFSLNELFEYSNLILQTIERETKFIKHPMVLRILALLGSFHGFFYVFNKNQENHLLFKKIRELLKSLNFAKTEKYQALLALLTRFSELKNMFQTRALTDTELVQSVPIVILENDIKILTNQAENRIPNVLEDVGPVLDSAIEEHTQYDTETRNYIKSEQNKLFQILASFKDFI
ncbi:Centromere DNA-binding protein complex CBF3 subunit B [Hanseniaspora osmophila]|uniref:Centromere DNA-binding protein complex CBF3 subunit B n=1 Tax=Hanseniaspora osmophila TaxID=56408 RepID=A0A1E5RNX6_9ASCO|nr:Centromere DNA-binding protein complex CBF3 subunit B [Hanseniaspora osmophila]